MRLLAAFIMTILVSLSPQSAAQEPTDVKFELATQNGRKVFRLGEAIDVEFRFTSTSPLKYQGVDILSGKRLAYISSSRFVAEPSAGVTDPLGDYPRETTDLPGVQFPGEFVLSETPAVLTRRLNEWLRFQKPGHYRITADTASVSTVGPTVTMYRIGEKPPETKPLQWFALHSNPIEIDIIEPEAGWADSVLRDAVAKRGSYYETISVTPVEANQPIVSVTATDAIRFLETREAAMAMIQLNGQNSFSSNLGIWSSLYRSDIIAGIRERMLQPSHALDNSELSDLSALEAAAKLGPRPKMDPRVGDPVWSSGFQNAYSEFVNTNRAEVLKSLDKKSESARAATEVELYRFEIYAGNPQAMEMLRRNMPLLPTEVQMSYLQNSRIFPAKENEAHLTAIASGQTPSRDLAVRLLFNLNSAAARTIILKRMSSGDFGSEESSLVILPDRLLPEMDDVLATAYEQRKPVDLLIARYSTAKIAGRIIAAFRETSPCTSIVAYFFRVDPAFAAKRFSDHLSCSRNYAGILMSAGLEDAAVRDLSSPDPGRREDATQLLRYAITAKPKSALLNALKTFRRFSDSHSNEELAYVGSLLESNGWIVTAEDLRNIEIACRSEDCHLAVTKAREQFQHPIDIFVLNDISLPQAWVGAYRVSSFAEFRSKILQFPKGTQFRAKGTEEIWVNEQEPESILMFLQKSGMRLVE
jgi:hypothetical protein